MQIGDIYLSAADGQEYSVIQTERGSFVNAFIDPLSILPVDPVWIFHCLGAAGKRTWQVHYPDLPVLVKRLTLCGKATCWKHYRELSDGVYRCQDHWMVGEEPIPAIADSRSLHKGWKKRKAAKC